jgi:hypothetical protein
MLREKDCLSMLLRCSILRINQQKPPNRQGSGGCGLLHSVWRCQGVPSRQSRDVSGEARSATADREIVISRVVDAHGNSS